ncbi:hypothetical protein OG495_37140 (plasmid) [Streptomyces longwoodensis]|uniref:hypothetical protein n=1 Tax=Streptomyces longwoodensis TaxID=68231 RepID=UPI002F9119EB
MQNPYRLGTPDWERRYPVIVGETVIGAAFRWHRDWLTLSSTGEENLGRPEKGTAGIEMAAAHLAAEYDAGHITAMSLADVTTPVPVLTEPVPLLHPRMPHTPRNVDTATAVLRTLREHRWIPFTGFPGSDNPWWQQCELCGWQGPRYWSHQRGRNGRLPSTHRHGPDETGRGCVSDEQVRKAITAYQD